MQLTVIGFTACAVVLLLAPGEPEVWLYNGGPYIIYPTIGLIIGGIFTIVISIVGCCAVHKDSKMLLILVSGLLVQRIYKIEVQPANHVICIRKVNRVIFRGAVVFVVKP